MGAAEVVIHWIERRSRQAEARTGDAGEAGRLPAIVQRAIAASNVAEMFERHVLLADEQRVAQAAFQVMQSDSAAPLQNQIVMTLEHLPEDQRSVRVRSRPEMPRIAVAGDGGVIA